MVRNRTPAASRSRIPWQSAGSQEVLTMVSTSSVAWQTSAAMTLRSCSRRRSISTGSSPGPRRGPGADGQRLHQPLRARSRRRACSALDASSRPMASFGGTARKRANPLPATSVQSPNRTRERISS